MAGQQRGVAACLQWLAPKAPYFHCASHHLNLALRKACDINDIQCMLNVIKTVGILFTYSPKKQMLLEECVESFNRGAVEDGTKAIYLRKVKLLCDTRWIERHTSIFDFCTLFGVIIYCLEIITQNDDESRKWDRKSITEADGLLHIICSSSFLVALNFAQFLFGFTSNVAKFLQSQTIDVIKAHAEIKLSITELQNVRSNAEKEFDSILIKVVEMANDCSTTIQIKRRCKEQTNRKL